MMKNPETPAPSGPAKARASSPASASHEDLEPAVDHEPEVPPAPDERTSVQRRDGFFAEVAAAEPFACPLAKTVFSLYRDHGYPWKNGVEEERARIFVGTICAWPAGMPVSHEAINASFAKGHLLLDSTTSVPGSPMLEPATDAVSQFVGRRVIRLLVEAGHLERRYLSRKRKRLSPAEASVIRIAEVEEKLANCEPPTELGRRLLDRYRLAFAQVLHCALPRQAITERLCSVFCAADLDQLSATQIVARVGVGGKSSTWTRSLDRGARRAMITLLEDEGLLEPGRQRRARQRIAEQLNTVENAESRRVLVGFAEDQLRRCQPTSVLAEVPALIALENRIAEAGRCDPGVIRTWLTQRLVSVVRCGCHPRRMQFAKHTCPLCGAKAAEVGLRLSSDPRSIGRLERLAKRYVDRRDQLTMTITSSRQISNSQRGTKPRKDASIAPDSSVPVEVSP